MLPLPLLACHSFRQILLLTCCFALFLNIVQAKANFQGATVEGSTASVCKGKTITIPDITIREKIKTDFKEGTGILKLVLSGVGFTLEGTPNIKFNAKLRDGFSATIQNNVLIINLAFVKEANESLDNVTIEGLKVTAMADVYGSTSLMYYPLLAPTNLIEFENTQDIAFAQVTSLATLSAPQIDNSTLNAICPGKTMTIVSTDVGAQQYQWDLPNGFTRVDDPGNNTTNSSTIRVTTATNITGKLSVRVKATGNGDCGANDFSPPYEITIKATQDFTVNGITSGEEISDDESRKTLSTTPSGGSFEGNGIIRSVVKNQVVYSFDPGEAGTGSHEITCTYDNGECEASKLISVKVYGPSELEGLANSYCKTTTSGQSFKVPQKWREVPSHYRYYVHHLITNSALAGTGPISSSGSVSCSYINTSYSGKTYGYTFTPSKAGSKEVEIKAVVIYQRWINNAWTCIKSYRVTLATVTITDPPVPDITTYKASFCLNDPVIYSVVPVAGATYKWTTSEPAVFNGNDVANQFTTTENNINVRWQTSGIKKISVQTIVGSCLSTGKKDKEVSIVPKPGLLSFYLEKNDITVLPVNYSFRIDDQIKLVPDVTPDLGGTGMFVITKDGKNQPQPQQDNEGVATLKMNTLSGAGTYTITYRYLYNDCYFDSKEVTIKVVSMPAIIIDGISADGYCIKNAAPVDLTTKISLNSGNPITNPDLKPDSIYFLVRKLSGNQTAPEVLKDDNKKLTYTFDPNRPLPSQQKMIPDASTSQWNKNAGTYALSFVYTNAQGTTVSEEINVTIRPLIKLTFTGLNATYCEDDPVVVLTPLANGSKITQGIFKYKKEGEDEEKIISNDQFSPKAWGAGTYEVFLEYTHDNCFNTSRQDVIHKVTILPSPKNVRVNVFKAHNREAMRLEATANDTNSSWQWRWEFNDGTTSKDAGLDKTISQDLLSYSLVATNGDNCAFSIEQKAKLGFSVAGHCQNSSTRFTNLSDLFDQMPISSLQWDFGDHKGVSNEVSPVYTYKKPGKYIVTLTIYNGAATYRLQKRVDIFPVISVATNKAYLEDFEQGAGGWLERGTAIIEEVKHDTSSWQCKTPDDTLMKDARGKVWLTDNGDKLEDDSTLINYYGNEYSYVESPCFDISQLDKPMFSFRYWSSTDEGADGIALFFTVDDGKTWHRLGKKDIGLNWYDTERLLAAPGGRINKGSQGWSGWSEGWHLASFSLDEVLIQMNAQNATSQRVRFRVVFASNGDNPAKTSLGGFAFDEVHLSSRSRVVLLEYFTNQGVAEAETLDKAAQEFPATGKHNEIISIHHHTGFPKKDMLNEQNHQDASGRTLYHGIKEVPVGIMDGQQREVKGWDENEFYNRTLIPSPFVISIGNPMVESNRLTATIDIQATIGFDRPVVIQVAVIDTLVQVDTDEGIKTFRHVVRKMLPDASGTYRTNGWQAGETQTLTVAWNVPDNLYPKGFKLVVFIEDYHNRSIHQAAVTHLKTQRPSGGNGGDQVTGVVSPATNTRLQLYPNPASSQLQIKFPYQAKNVSWQVTTITGKVVKQGIWSPASRSIDLAALAEGVYWLKVVAGNKVFHRKFEKN